MSRPSRSPVVITGAGLVSPLGDDVETWYRALLDGSSGLGPLDAFDHERLRVRRAGQVRFDPREQFPGRNFRPVDRTGQLAILAARGALESSGLAPAGVADADDSDAEGPENGPAIGLVLGTMFGSVHTIAAFDRRGLEAGPKYVKPFDFANSVINAAAGQTAIWHGLRGTNATVAGGLCAGIQALGQAYEHLRSGRADAILAGGAEELCFESYYGFQQAGALAANPVVDDGPDDGPAAEGRGEATDEPPVAEPSPPGPPVHQPHARPFDARRHGFLLGEGAALLALERAEDARARGARARARVLAHATSFDTSRGRDSERAATALERAIRIALDRAGLEAAQVDAVSAGANGSRAGDRTEALGLGRVLAGRPVPVMAIKSQLGESLGAGGAMQALAALLAMETGQVPGIADLGVVDPELAATGLDFGPGVRRIEVRHVLITGVGLDGLVGAAILGPADRA